MVVTAHRWGNTTNLNLIVFRVLHLCSHILFICISMYHHSCFHLSHSEVKEWVSCTELHHRNNLCSHLHRSTVGIAEMLDIPQLPNVDSRKYLTLYIYIYFVIRLILLSREASIPFLRPCLRIVLCMVTIQPALC